MLQVLEFLMVVDIINLYLCSKRFLSIIFNAKHKLLFKLVGNICNEKRWVAILHQNFSDFLNRLREVLHDNLETFFYLQFRFHSFIYNKVSLYPIFAHFFLLKEHVTEKTLENTTVIFVLKFILKFFDNENIFNDIILDEQDFTSKFNKF